MTKCLNYLLRLWGVTCTLGEACLLIVTELIFKGMQIYCLVGSLKIVTLWSCWFHPKSTLALTVLASHTVILSRESSGLVRTQGKSRSCAWEQSSEATIQKIKLGVGRSNGRRGWSFGASVNMACWSDFPSVSKFPLGLASYQLHLFLSHLLIHN